MPFKRIGTSNGVTVLERKKELAEYLQPGESVIRWRIWPKSGYVEADIFDGIPEEKVEAVEERPDD